MTQRSVQTHDSDGRKTSDGCPRGRHHERDGESSSSKRAHTASPEPDCGSGTAETDWKTCPVTGALLAFFDPCSDCFPDGEIHCETVVRSRNQHASFVHLQKGATNSPARSENVTASSNASDDDLARAGGAHMGGSR
jgi:hypothetical protein